MTQPTIRAALLGAGYISSWHAQAIKRAHGVELTGVCDVSRGAAQALADAHGGVPVFGSLDEMLQAGVADAIHILTPPHLHAEAAETIINAGVAAFVEKPFALSAADCSRLDQLANEKNVALGVNHNFLMLPSYDKLKRDIQRGVIGPIDTFEANWQFPLPPLRSGPFNLWMLRESGNLLFELGPHLFAFVADIFGELEDIAVDLKYPIAIPGGVKHYQGWRITGRAGDASITVNISLVEGADNRSIALRGLGARARYDFAQDIYQLERAAMGDIVVGPFSQQMSAAGQAMGAGAANTFRQLKSLNALAPYGLSIQRAVERFYHGLSRGEPVDRRLSAGLAAKATAMIETVLKAAAPDLEQIDHEDKPAPPANGKTMLVIGGTGFIGRALCDALFERGYNVRIFSRGSGGGMARQDGRSSVYTGDLKSDDDLRDAMNGVDGVFHLAKATESSWRGYLENDVAVTRRIGEACIAAGVRRLVYTGTIDSYDASQPDRPITEETPFDHDLERRNLYARSKAACEETLKELADTQGLPLVIVRPGIVIGKGGPLQHWGIAMWRGATACKMWGDGRNILPFVLVDDVADGLVLSMETADVEARSFNLIGDPMLSARDYFTAVGEANRVNMRAQATPIWTYYIVDVVKYWLKRVLAKKSGLTKPSFRDWKSRAQLSPYENKTAKSALGWTPESDRNAFIKRAIGDANLFGIYTSKTD
ncbi:NAD-dependent epimerase/dehydratase family protein [Hyphococcus sp.]|uniref:NAD-dependent epimerase/dehydratase family protein n=1 Tax=Hyphococcus sp. TaxID=2038636 RepID=UPI003CCB9A4C